MIILPRTVFCSDFHLHLSPAQMPHLVQFFLDRQENGESLVILGDLFYFWWGDDHADPIFEEWEYFFANLKIPKYLLLGNRDFLIGKRFYERTGFIPLDSAEIVQIGGHQIALFHGDEPGLQDSLYQVWRCFYKNFWVQQLFLSLPVSWRKQIGLYGRQQRDQHVERIKNFNPLEINIKKWLESCWAKPNMIINGHLHYPLVEEVEPGLIRYQLGCWDHGQYSWIVIDPESGIEHYHSQTRP